MIGTRRLSALLVSGLVALAPSTAAAHADPLPGAGTADVQTEATIDMAHLTAVRMAGHDGFDRMVLGFGDHVPGDTIGYRPLPAREDASGFEIPLPGAGALLQMTLSRATAAGWGGGPQTYSGPWSMSANTGSVTELRSAGDFEAMLTWVAGVRAQEPFRVLVLEGPPRLVVDVGR
jgi:hypothetical protein